MYTKLAIKNWVNSSGFNVMLDEIIAHCIEGIDAYCGMRDRGFPLNFISPLNVEPYIDSYMMVTSFPIVLRNGMKAEIMKKYGSLLHKKLEERLRTNNLNNDF